MKSTPPLPRSLPLRATIGTILLMGTLLMVGCSNTPRVYTQQPGPAVGADLIQVRCDSETHHKLIPGANTTVTITELDGKSLVSTTDKYFLNGRAARAGGFDIAHVTPGRHQLKLHWKHTDTYADITVVFEAELGKSYIVRGDEVIKSKLFDLGKVAFWIEEEGTGVRVSRRVK